MFLATYTWLCVPWYCTAADDVSQGYEIHTLMLIALGSSLTYLEDDGRILVSRNIPEHDVDGHGAQQQRHTAGHSLHAGEGAVARGVHYRHPNVLIPETRGCPSLENIAGEGHRKWVWIHTVWTWCEYGINKNEMNSTKTIWVRMKFLIIKVVVWPKIRCTQFVPYPKCSGKMILNRLTYVVLDTVT